MKIIVATGPQKGHKRATHDMEHDTELKIRISKGLKRSLTLSAKRRHLKVADVVREIIRAHLAAIKEAA